MAYETLIKEAEELREDQMQEVIGFILFLKAKSSGEEKKNKKRTLGVFKEESFLWLMILMRRRSALRSMYELSA